MSLWLLCPSHAPIQIAIYYLVFHPVCGNYVSSWCPFFYKRIFRTAIKCLFLRGQSQKELYHKYNNTADGRIRIWFGIRQIMNSTDRLLLETRDAAKEFKTGIHMVNLSLFYLYRLSISWSFLRRMFKLLLLTGYVCQSVLTSYN